jgi:serine/threonine-protein kinase
MPLAPGLSLRHFRLVDRIGEGGMGEVWRAIDTTLDREVAIKVLPAAFAAEPERMARFEREAKVLASLNHPNIAAIYGFPESGGVRFLAMELVRGEDLAQILARGPLPLRETLDAAQQIAAALEAAHDSGVIHRDLKPANVKRTPEGQIKVLDFGLAKALESAAPNTGRSATVTSAGSVAGMILGTASYMSPEQARGQAVDRRTDLWAFGCVLYEMLAGVKAFDGPTRCGACSGAASRRTRRSVFGMRVMPACSWKRTPTTRGQPRSPACEPREHRCSPSSRSWRSSPRQHSAGGRRTGRRSLEPPVRSSSIATPSRAG